MQKKISLTTLSDNGQEMKENFQWHKKKRKNRNGTQCGREKGMEEYGKTSRMFHFSVDMPVNKDVWMGRHHFPF